ncbi:hypothetical protein HYC85_019693 [Camellia sinensis]|uniref:Pyruvate carboxyltransferase domain-containing protein n=1 Tax=Camellia sinensis TaxID=4442 RepID=A0A7J7GQ71_CAMSI|nr:hypothetical protein HYC85_019693 [Camellia sinensis]
MTSKEKLDIARQLSKLGVDIIEAAFPASSKDDLQAVKVIAQEVGNAVDENGYVPVICGLTRCNKRDIDAAWEAVKYAKRPRIHTFIATSEIHMEFKLKMTREEVVETAQEYGELCEELWVVTMWSSVQKTLEGRFLIIDELNCLAWFIIV